IDFNPLHSSNVGNKFLVVTDQTPTPGVVTVSKRNSSNIYASGTTVYYDVIVNTTMGMPVQDYPLTALASPGGIGTLTIDDVTAWDGTATGSYAIPLDVQGDSYPERGVAVIVSAGASASGSINVEVGAPRV
ncbi:MAG: hypothetical protein ACXABY_22100, partial [Candidatus Thorarchaeota archaeon]